MPLSINTDGSNWHSAVPSVNIDGTSTWHPTKMYVNIDGGTTWKKVYCIPSGLIIMYNAGDTNYTGLGWTRYSAADGAYILSTGSTYPTPAQTGGTINWSTDVTTETAGGHAGVIYEGAQAGRYVAGQNIQSSYNLYTSTNLNDGVHSHTASVGYNPLYQNMVLIKAGSDLTQIPAYGMFFGASALSGFTEYDSTGNYLKGASVASTGGGGTVTTSLAGSHTHGSSFLPASSWVSGPILYADTDTYTITNNILHTHTGWAIVTENFKRATLIANYKASAYGLKRGLIGMWDGATVPTGWSLCNGSNGTPDLRDCFIKFSTSFTSAGSVGSGITISAAETNTDSWIHNHKDTFGGGTDTLSPIDCYDGSTTVSHSHTISDVSGLPVSYTPNYYTLTFIQFTG